MAVTLSGPNLKQQVLSIEEMGRAFPGEWVLIGDPEVDENLEVLRGAVLYHSPSRLETLGEVRRGRAKAFAWRFMGEPVIDGIIAL